jgi:cold shock CspA family protein/ribosome-associated translation inhibitor RaiA
MQVPLQVSYHHVDPSAALEIVIRTKAAELESFYGRIIACHVGIERAGEHHRKGKGAHYRVRIELTVPGRVLVVGRDPIWTRAHEDAFLAVNEAFHAMRRQLQDYVRRMRRNVKTHEGPPHGRVVRVFREEGYGFLQSTDGREIYFNKASVLNEAFDRLEPGDEVRFAEEQGEKGPQASTVQRLGSKGHHAPEPNATRG